MDYERSKEESSGQKKEKKMIIIKLAIALGMLYIYFMFQNIFSLPVSVVLKYEAGKEKREVEEFIKKTRKRVTKGIQK